MRIYLKFTHREVELIRKHRSFYEDLASGNRKPTTEAQKHFLSVCKGLSQATTDHEKVWIKYKKYLAEPKQKKAGKRKKSDYIPSQETRRDITAQTKRKPQKNLIASILNDAKENRKECFPTIPLPRMEPAGVPEFEEGTPSYDFFTREGSKKMRGQVKADLLRRKSDFDS